MEQWKKIDGYDNYSVSDMGRVRNDRTGRILKPGMRRGYQSVMLYPGRKMMSVHRLVAMMFIPNPNNLPQVNHINEDKMSNQASNLEWCTVEYNNNYGVRVKQMRVTHPNKKRCIVDGVEYVSVHEASRQLNISRNSLKMALNRGQSHCLGHKISYVS